MSQYSYIATSQRSTTVSQALISHFTSAVDINLILVKNNNVEVYLYKDEQLLLLFTSPFFDRIKNIELFKSNNKSSSSSIDHMFMLTERKNYCILCYDPQTKNMKTKASGNFVVEFA